ncbi:MAG: single-strand DNA-binding protein [Pseudomonadota bacterium]|nr:single-strand DNA-binding protein [Pseudomonadota bacterium]
MGKWYQYEKPQYKDTSMQSVFILGRLGKDPETRTVGNTQVTKFSVATGYKKSDGTQHTDWHQVEAWAKTSEIAQKYLKKGDQVALQGEIRYSQKDDKYFTSIVANRLELLGSRQQQTTHPVSGATTAQVDPFDIPDDMVPF